MANTTTNEPTTVTTKPAIADLSPIDMCDPAQVCTELRIDEATLISLVNDGQLAAYNLGGSIRFQARAVRALTTKIAIAA